MSVWTLLTTFFLIGLGSYGGGMVTVSLIFHEVVEKQAWMTAQAMKNAITLSQLTPGPIAINTATYTGFTRFGIPGALLTTLSVILPAIILLTILVLLRRLAQKHIKVSEKSWILPRFMHSLRPGILALLIHATWSFGRSAITGWPVLLIFSVSLVLLLSVKKIHPIFIMIGAGLIGLFVF
jgi:chromate transporter